MKPNNDHVLLYIVARLQTGMEVFVPEDLDTLSDAITEVIQLRETLRWRKFCEVKPPLNIDAIEVFSADLPEWSRHIEHLEEETWDWEGFKDYTHWRPTTPAPEKETK